MQILLKNDAVCTRGFDHCSRFFGGGSKRLFTQDMLFVRNCQNRLFIMARIRGRNVNSVDERTGKECFE
jgi:hypothetical protein